ncbi:serine hydrolase domain-containing protein [Brevibacterium samyangense]|uniref:Beta-lactamase-related domain-containing protein n=1 Tax=Brevibacterium samyangense TaxID=366888 RepID=A0ABP5ETQ9_9MICO
MSLSSEQTLAVLTELAPYLSDWTRFQVEYSGTPGAQVAVAYRGELLVNAAHGLANTATGEPLTADHLFRIASHSKTFTAVALLRLVEEGRLRLDDTVAAWIPALADCEAGSRTVRELLGHQGGYIRDSADGDFWQRGFEFLGEEELLEVVRREGIVYPANTSFKYSNISYSVLGLVIEAVTGKPYAEALAEFVVEPLGLQNTGPEYVEARGSEYAAGHTGRTAFADERRVIPHVDTRAMAAATGWFSTAAEMTVYGAAHVLGDETLLSDASKRLMQREETRVLAPHGDIRRYGLGMDLQRVGERELVGHSGGYPGHITRTWIDPEDGLVVSALTNAIDGPAATIAAGVVEIIDAVLAAVESVLSGDEEAIPEHLRFSGRFANLWGVTDVVSVGASVDAPVLLTVGPRAPLPKATLGRLVYDPEHDRLLTEPEPGFTAHGEPVVVEWDGAGGARGERGADGGGGASGPRGGEVHSARIGAMTSWPIDRYRAAIAGERPDRDLDGKLSLH